MVIDYFFLKNKYNIKPKGVIHIGAHHGQEVKTYYSDKDIKKIVMFEASPSTFSVLKENLTKIGKPDHIESITAYAVGLGPKEDVVDFHIASNSQSSSVLKPKLHLSQHPDITFSSVEKVTIKSLDSFNLTDFDFINMDVQGYELEVLKGSIKTLEHIKWIYTEVNNDMLYENCTMINDLDSFLWQYGFRREETSWCRLHGNWGDALYIKT